MASFSKTVEENLIGYGPEGFSPAGGFTASVIDLGFNSMNLVNYRVTDRSSFMITSQDDAKVQLGEELDQTGFLGSVPVERTLRALRTFKEIAQLESARYILPVATSAVRDAGDRDEFLETTHRVTGLRFRVLSEEEEALLSYFGAVQSTKTPTSVYFDLGGGSLAIVYAERFKVKKVMCLPLGARRLTYLYCKKDGTVAKKDYEELKDHILDLLPSRKELGVRSAALLTGVGGTARALVRYHQEITEYPFEKLHNYRMSFDDVSWVAGRFAKMSRRKLRSILSIGPSRAETMVAGSCVIRMLLKKLGLSELAVSTNGLREGTLSLFLQDRRWFHSRTVDAATVEKHLDLNDGALRTNWARNVNEMYAGELVGPADYPLLLEGKHLARSCLPTVNLRNLFEQLMYVDCNLDHPDQLKLSISIVGSTSKRFAEKLSAEYNKTMLKKRDRKVIQRLSAALKLLELLEKLNAGCTVQGRGGMAKIIFMSSRELVQQDLLGSAVQELADELDVNLSYSIKDRRPVSTMEIER